MIAAVLASAPLTEGIDAKALGAGFGLGTIVVAISWWALIGITLLRSLLTDAAE